MKDEFNRLHNKVDKIDDKLDNIDTHLAIYNEQLKIHIKRTELLEEDVKPIKKHVAYVGAAFKIVGTAAAISIGLLTAIKPFIN